MIGNHLAVIVERGAKSIACPDCNGYCDKVDSTFEECKKYGCGQDRPGYECCAVTYVCRNCGKRWAGSQKHQKWSNTMLDEYFELREKVFAYFGYVEDWCALPLDDCRKYYWFLTGEGRGDSVCFAKTEKELAEQDGNYYESEIYTQRFLPKWVYRGAEYTLVVVDTHTDGNKLLSIFTNSKERK